MNFGNALCITKILDSKILVFHIFSITASIALHELPCIIPSSSIAAANVEVSKLLPVGMTEYPTQSVSSPTRKRTYAKLTPKQRATYHWKLCCLAWNKCCSTTLQEIIS